MAIYTWSALTNDPNDRNAILAVDLCTFQLREFQAMAKLAERLGKPREARQYRGKADRLRRAARLEDAGMRPHGCRHPSHGRWR